jgi:hypothetical protein
VRAVCGSASHVAAGGVKVFLPKMVPLVCAATGVPSVFGCSTDMLRKSMLAKCVLSNSNARRCAGFWGCLVQSAQALVL